MLKAEINHRCPALYFTYKSVSGLTMARKNIHFNCILEFLTSRKTILERILILQRIKVLLIFMTRPWIDGKTATAERRLRLTD